MANFTTLFAGITNGDISDNSTDWTRGRKQGTWLENIITDGGNSSGKALKFDTNGWGTQGTNSVAHNTLGSVTGQLDIIMQIQVAATLNTLDYPIGILMIDGTGFVANNNTSITNPQAGYGLSYRGTGSWQVLEYDNTGTSTGGIGSASANIFTPAANTDFWIRFTRTSGNLLEAKVWGTSEASEPGSYQVNAAGTTDTTYGGVLVGAAAQDGNYTVTIRGIAGSTDGNGTATLGGGAPPPTTTHNSFLSLGVG